ncbi:hypothetical protein [Nonomuraea soli]|uniref:Alkaline shock response membrane anchor protein AmaP n=1 Tax=Nonomuraea soli TaxID=1032476 RepID=A0A7W0CL45_9ACTN|nr:hypothetical protein [Nonomuraea soli]MBA2893173.1 hypothetical protein [Nonomuraea soli]
MRQYSGNRIGLTVVGFVLLLSGGFVWLRGTHLAPKTKVVPPRLADSVADQPWMLWLVALLLVFLTLVCLRWLLLSLGWGRVGQRTETGAAMLTVGLKDLDGVSATSVRVVGDGERLRVGITCRASADLGAVVGKLDRELVGKIRREVCDNELGTLVRVHVRK